MIITITGLIGSGKTTCARFFADKGATVINVDAIGQKVLQGPAKKQVIKAFGNEILRKDGKTIDARRLADKVFHDKRSLHKLHTITHPYIKREIRRSIKKHKVTVIDAALYKDFDLHKISDYTILVKAPAQLRAKRLAGIHSEKDMMLRQRYQTEPKKADFVIQNTKHAFDLKRQVEKIWAMVVS